MHINLFTRPSHWTFWEGGISTLDVGFIGKNAIKNRVFPIDEKKDQNQFEKCLRHSSI